MRGAGTMVRGRRRRWSSRLKRLALELLSRDPRFRRSALNHLFAQHLADGILCLVTFKDHQLFVNPRDDKISFTLMSGKPWQRSDLEAAFGVAQSAGRLRQGSVFVDVGANIGAITIYAGLSGLFRHVIAIEPDALNRSVLERNVSINGMAERVTVVPVAASRCIGEMTLHRDQKNLGAHSLEPDFATTPGSLETVTVQPLDHIVAQAGFSAEDIGFIKIDVEGHESDVLHGMSDILASGPPILMEATFDLRNEAQSRSVPVFAPLPETYGSCADVAQRSNSGDLPALVALDSFAPTSLQHDLVIL